MVYKRGDIVLVNFNPQEKGEEIGKIRPAIIISDTDLNSVLDLVTVIALTANLIDDALPLRIRIKKKDSLTNDSDAMVEQIRFLSKSRIGQKVAEVLDSELKLVENGIREMLRI